VDICVFSTTINLLFFSGEYPPQARFELGTDAFCWDIFAEPVVLYRLEEVKLTKET
jgi:hypothetical protein